ncbi:serine hydrolase (FSH1) domain-containing protein [Sarocladium implicatum]|nr:serine hydrolase (FSH1) domain-containing protein [Sarocladium implicatum]
MPSLSPLPTILCIHGHGTSGEIFRLQSRRIVQALDKSFRFVFIDAPFESLPGPGVVPVFSELAPFWRWHCDGATLNKSDITQEEIDAERRTTRDMLASQVDKINQDSPGGVAGIMAFSQGTRVATGLMLDAELRKNIKFAIIICGTFPVLAVDQSQIAAVGVSATVAQKLGIPSIHLHGSYDPWHAEGIRLKQTYYDENLASSIKFKGGHQVPAGKKEAEEVASWVQDMWKRRDEFTLA